MNKEVVVIAGGTGFIGRKLQAQLISNYEVRILTRKKEVNYPYFSWNPNTKTIDEKVFEKCSILINLCGEGIADKRWTKNRIKELIDSRVETTKLLFEFTKNLSSLKHYITASGINCYPIQEAHKMFSEKDAFGEDFVSQLVEKWENSADLFSTQVSVSKMRISFVLDGKNGGLVKLMKPIKLGVGSAIGTGNQSIPWIHIDDLVAAFANVIQYKHSGTFNLNADNTTNFELSKTLAKVLNKPFFFPKIPSFIIKLIFGKMSVLLLTGIKADNKKIYSTGVKFKFPNLISALENI